MSRNIFGSDELGLLIQNLQVIQILAENPEGANTRALWTTADGRADSAIDAAKVKADCWVEVSTQAFETFQEWVVNPRGYGWSHPFHLEWRDLAEPERSQFIAELIDFYRRKRSAGTQAGHQFDLLDVLISMNAEQALDLIEPELHELRDPAWKYEHAPYRHGEVRIDFDEPLSERVRMESIVRLLERRHLLGDGRSGDAAEVLSYVKPIAETNDWRGPNVHVVVSALKTIGVAQEDGESAIAVASMLSRHAEHTYSGYEIWTKMLGVPAGARMFKVRSGTPVPEDMLAEAADLARRHLGIVP